MFAALMGSLGPGLLLFASAASAGPDQALPPLRIEQGANGASNATGSSPQLTGPAEQFSLPTGKSLTLNFVSQDALSGVDDVYVQLNEGPYNRSANRRLELRADGFYVVRWYSVDRAGNRSAEQVRAIRIDSTPPKLQFALSGTRTGPMLEVGGGATLALSASDEGCGVESLQWRRGAQEAWQPYVSPLPLRDLAFEGGRGLIEYRATDRLQNETPIESFQYLLDLTPPALPRMFGDAAPGESVLINRQGIRFPAVEKGATLEYRLNDESFSIAPQEQPLILDREGPATLTIRVTDAVGNSQQRSFTLNIDLRSPETEIRTEP
ncbi:MAG: hypothetical protein K1X75_01290 [Leptospirales bacterium]|nr:hypothetical protein [Leptospirales bacterium]